MPKPAGNNPCAVDAAAIDRKDVFLPGEICSWAAETEARASAEEKRQGQKSAEAIVGSQTMSQ